MPKWLIIVVYWLSGACLVAAVGYWIGEDSYRLSTQGRTAIATVTRIEKRTTGSGQNTQTSTVHHVRFESADAQIHQGVIDAGWFAPETGETIEILYDPGRIGFRELLEVFFQIHDPTTLNRQGNDIGTAYRSAIFPTTPAQQAAAETTREAFQGELTRVGAGEISTVIQPAEQAGPFWYAEDYHQQYLHKNPNGYCNHGPNGLTCPVGVANLPAQVDVAPPSA